MQKKHPTSASARTIEWQNKNPEHHRWLRRQIIDRKIDLINEIKETTPCQDCLRIFPACVMEFDHIYGRIDGRHTINYAVEGWPTILAEWLMCDLVCANCHNIRTYRRRMAAEKNAH